MPAQIRPAEERDADAIVAIIRQGFAAERLGLFIYGCDGMARFVSYQIAAQQAGSDTVYAVADDGDRVIGCVELRIFERELFLNYIAVKRECQERGFGSRLLRAAIERVHSPRQTTMPLDVLDDNPARQWYARLGFTEGTATSWWDWPIAEAGERGLYYTVADFPSARTCHAVFGFGQFRLRTSAGEYMVGLLSDRWFRVTQPTALRDPAVPVALRTIDPGRRLLALIPEEAVPHTAGERPRLLARTLRMTAPLDALIENLLEKK